MRSRVNRTSRISRVGICGRKSLPTKKHMKIKSSTMRSKSISNGRFGILISNSRYSLRVQMFRNWIRKHICETHAGQHEKSSQVFFIRSTWKGFLATTGAPFSSKSPDFLLALPSQSAATWPIWPHKKHLSCPGVNTICNNPFPTSLITHKNVMRKPINPT